MHEALLVSGFKDKMSAVRHCSRRLYVGLLAFGVIAVTAPQASASTYDFVGRWMNFDRDSSGITGMVITPNRYGLDIEVFGLCRGRSVCDWSISRANVYMTGGPTWGGFVWNFGGLLGDVSVVTASFDAGYARKFIVLRRESKDVLRVEVFTDSSERYDRPGYVTQGRLQRWGRLPQIERDRYPDVDSEYPDDDYDQ
ncbi:MAG: hypothetical protein ACT4OG_06380 [Alphaproteobacteria bacterium]